MKVKKIFPAIILFTASLLFVSCDNTTGPVSTVSGKVYSRNLSPLANQKVTIGSQSVHTSEDGSFTLGGISFPYDIIVTDSLEHFSAIFKNLSADNIFLPVDNYNSYPELTYVSVQIPGHLLQQETQGKIYLTNGNFFNYVNYLSNTDTVTLVYLPLNIPVTARIIILTYKRNFIGEIISYENYGESPDIQMVPGGSYSYAFDSTQLSLNPGEETVSGTIDIPLISSSSGSEYYLSFSQKKSYSSSWMPVNGGTNFHFPIPTGLPRQFVSIVKNYSYGGPVGSSNSLFTAYPNTPNRLVVNYAPELISPVSNITDVNNNTLFSFSSGTGKGVYVIGLENRSRFTSYNIITTNTNFTLGDLEKMGLGNINNNEFNWHVRKVGPAESMNDYVTNFLNDPNSFSSRSQERYFTTEP